MVTGNPGKRQLNVKEPKPRGNLYDPPSWFDEGELKAWAYIMDAAPLNLLKRADQSTLVTFIVSQEIYRKAAINLKEEKSLLETTPNGMSIQSPYIGIMNKQALIMLKCASEMGFTPSSRSRVKHDDPDDGEENNEAKYFG